jgi:hypothetical protein
MDIDEVRMEHFHVTVRWRLGGEARDPSPEDVHAILAEGLRDRLGIRHLMELSVTRVPMPD